VDAIAYEIGRLVIGALLFFGLIKVFSWFQESGDNKKWLDAGRRNQLREQIDAAESKHRMLPQSSAEAQRLADSIKIDRAQLKREEQRVNSWWYRLFTNL
jgi:hypothetical protein